MPDETPKVEVKKEKPWYRRFKVITGIATIVLDAVTILVSQLVTDPTTAALILKLMMPITAVGISVITGHSVTNAAYALKK